MQNVKDKQYLEYAIYCEEGLQVMGESVKQFMNLLSSLH